MPTAVLNAVPLAYGETRSLFRLLRAVLHLLWGSITIAVVFRFLAAPARRRLKQRWSRQLVEILGLRLVFAGEAPQGLLVANHISFLDIYVINAIAPTAFVSKNDVLGWPLIGWLCRRTETIFLERGSRLAAQRTREVLTAYLHAGGLAAVFPEGTTTPGDRLLPFHGALLQSALDAGVPVTPVAVRYRTRHGQRALAPAYVDDISLLDCLKAVVKADGLVAEVRALAPLSAADGDRRRLATLAHRHIARALDLPAHGEDGATPPAA